MDQLKYAETQVSATVSVTEPVPLDEDWENVDAVRERIRAGGAILELVEYPWGVELDVCDLGRAMSSDGKVRVVVKSRKVPAHVVEFQQTMYSPSGIPMGMKTNRQVLYAYVLDQDHQKTIEEARKLARSLCLDLEVVDSGKQGFFGRLLSSLGRSGVSTPSVVVSPSSTTLTSAPRRP